jgi:hypothetical protein
MSLLSAVMTNQVILAINNCHVCHHHHYCHIPHHELSSPIMTVIYHLLLYCGSDNGDDGHGSYRSRCYYFIITNMLPLYDCRCCCVAAAATAAAAAAAVERPAHYYLAGTCQIYLAGTCQIYLAGTCQICGLALAARVSGWARGESWYYCYFFVHLIIFIMIVNRQPSAVRVIRPLLLLLLLYFCYYHYYYYYYSSYCCCYDYSLHHD